MPLSGSQRSLVILRTAFCPLIIFRTEKQLPYYKHPSAICQELFSSCSKKLFFTTSASIRFRSPSSHEPEYSILFRISCQEKNFRIGKISDTLFAVRLLSRPKTPHIYLTSYHLSRKNFKPSFLFCDTAFSRLLTIVRHSQGYLLLPYNQRTQAAFH